MAASSGVTRFQQAVGATSGWRRAAVATIAGSLSVLAFAPFYASPILFLTLPVFVWLIDRSRSPRDAGIAGWFFGFGYFFFNLVWIGEAFLVEADKFAWLLPFAITLLPAGLALFWAWAAALMRRFWSGGLARILIFAIVLSIAEWLRGHIFTGLPWNVPGYALTAPLELMQAAGIFGIYGLTLIALIVFAAPLVMLSDVKALGVRQFIAAAAMALTPLALLFAFGAYKLDAPQEFVGGVKLRIVQPSVLQTEKWRPEHQRRIFDDHLALSKTNPQGNGDELAGVTHVIWPEAAMPFFPLEAPQALDEIGGMLPPGVTLVTGALRREPSANEAAPPKVFNSVLAFNDAATLIAQFDKIHLVPFGEYLPAEKMLTAFGLKKLTAGRGAFSSGPAPRQLMAVAGLPPIAALVCYEALFPQEIVQSGERPGLLLNVTNDGWFGNSTGPRQHFHQSRVRAVEQGVPLIRAANNGISAVVDANGRIIAELGMNVRGVIDSALPSIGSQPLYARYGDLIFAALLIAAAAVAAVGRRGLPRR